MPPDPTTAWTGISWQRLAADDPLAQIQSVLRWRGGFVALGRVIATGSTSRTPVWVSEDGSTWQPLATDVFGPSIVVIGVEETATGLVALTLHGGATQCEGQAAPLYCWSLAAPLQSWTSIDSTKWIAHPGPAGIAHPSPGCETCGIEVPIFRTGTRGLLVTAKSHGTASTDAQAALSTDGIGWETLPADAFPVGFGLADVTGFRPGFVAVGKTRPSAGTFDADPGHATAISSVDGRQWVPAAMPIPGLDPLSGSTANGIVAGSNGLLVTGSDFDTPGPEFWWSSVTGTTWSRLSGYPPLGVWTGDGEGSGLIPNGTLLGDGERMLAYRGGSKPTGWTSLDGRTWRSCAISGPGPTNAGDWPLQMLILTPFGLLGTGDNGTTWFGAPQT